jgi:Peptidase A4 family
MRPFWLIVMTSTERGENCMKSLLARVGVALLGASLILLLGSSVPRSADSSGRATDPAVVAQAHAAFIKYMSAHATAVTSGSWVSPGAVHGSAAKVANGSVTSLPTVNWSGYADAESSSSQTFTDVSGDWVMPGVTCPTRPYQNSDVFLANWVGLDGVTDQTVEQLGTAAQCFEGVTYYYVWYEMYPAGTVEEGTAACINENVDCPQPGDRISASVSVTPGSSGENDYTLSLTDHTNPSESFSVSQECASSTCLDSSAEWVIERPAVLPPFGVQILPLADFGRTAFTNGSLVSDGTPSSIGGFQGGPVYDVTMADDTDSYYLDCVGQTAPVGTLLSTTPNQCPTVAPINGNSFFATWDAGF